MAETDTPHRSINGSAENRLPSGMDEKDDRIEQLAPSNMDVSDERPSHSGIKNQNMLRNNGADLESLTEKLSESSSSTSSTNDEEFEHYMPESKHQDNEKPRGSVIYLLSEDELDQLLAHNVLVMDESRTFSEDEYDQFLANNMLVMDESPMSPEIENQNMLMSSDPDKLQNEESNSSSNTSSEENFDQVLPHKTRAMDESPLSPGIANQNMAIDNDPDIHQIEAPGTSAMANSPTHPEFYQEAAHNLHRCHHCPKNFKTEVKLQEHLEMLTSEPRVQRLCANCKWEMSSSSESSGKNE